MCYAEGWDSLDRVLRQRRKIEDLPRRSCLNYGGQIRSFLRWETQWQWPVIEVSDWANQERKEGVMMAGDTRVVEAAFHSSEHGVTLRKDHSI